jgi:predicted ATPase
LKIEYNLSDSKSAYYFLEKTGEGENFLSLSMKNGHLFNPLELTNQKGFYYLCAERLGPRLFFEKPVQTFNHCGWQGEYTVAVLDNLNTFPIDEVKRFKSATATNLNTVLNDLQTPLDGVRSTNLAAQLKFQIEQWMDFLIPGISLDAIELPEINRTRIEYGGYTPHNVGFGISYVLPIVVTCLIAEPNSVVILENPESHLHPLGQSRMGQFLAQMATSNIQIVVETHSEHLINGMRIAAVNKENSFSPDDLSINFFTKDEDDNAVVKNIQIDERGELSEWPDGFFDQAEQDYLTILKLRRA